MEWSEQVGKTCLLKQDGGVELGNHRIGYFIGIREPII